MTGCGYCGKAVRERHHASIGGFFPNVCWFDPVSPHNHPSDIETLSTGAVDVATIRRATTDDAELLARLAERTFRDAFAAEHDPTDVDLHCATNFGTEIQQQEILAPDCMTFVANVEDELVAFAQIRLRSPKQCVCAERPSELHRLYVSSEWHGRGIAHGVMSEVLATVASAGADYIWLGVWEKNPKAIAFYRKYGFKIVGEHVFQVGADPTRDLIMMVKVDGQSVSKNNTAAET